jgi:hypothetical protein
MSIAHSLFRFRSKHFFFSESIKVIELIIIAKQFKYYADCSVTLCPDQGKDKSIMRVAQYTLALQRYRGGHPVPRAASLYDGGV